MGIIETIKRQEWERGFKIGIKKGIEKRKREKAIAIAMEFKKMGYDIAVIAKGTGLSIEQIEKL